VDLRLAVGAFLDRQRLSLTTHVEEQEDVVDDRMPVELAFRAAALLRRKVGQDKFGEFLKGKIGWNLLG
jgi:hypothetical protein